LSRTISENLLLIGKVVRPHGIRGALKIKSYASSPATFSKAGKVYFYVKGKLEERRLIFVKPLKEDYLLLKLEGITTRNDAEEFRGIDLYIDKSILEKEEDEFFWFEIIGLKVYLVDGRYIGKVTEILQTGSNDVYVVEEKDREYLIPAIDDVIKEINLEDQKMIINPLDGLLELGEKKKKRR